MRTTEAPGVSASGRVRQVLGGVLSSANVATWEQFLNGCGASHAAVDQASAMFSLQEKDMHEEFEALFEAQVADACRCMDSPTSLTDLQVLLAQLHQQGDAMVDTFATVVTLATSLERFADVVRSPQKREYLVFILRQYARQFEESAEGSEDKRK